MAPRDKPAPLSGSSNGLTPSGRPLPPRQRKIAVLGSRGVGKSSMVVQFVDNHFVESYYPTIEEQFAKEFRYRGKDYHLDIQDTAGHDEFSLLNAKYAVGWHGYIIVYSVASRPSFEMVSIIRDKILSYSGVDKFPLCIVGNKNDLDPHLRTVSLEDGKALARKLNCAFIETSAKEGDNVLNAFQLVVAEIEKELNPDSAKGSAGGQGSSQSWGSWFKGVMGSGPGSSSSS